MQTANEETRLVEMAKDNLQMMKNVVEILSEELTKYPNYKNYLLKYGTYKFAIDKSNCKYLCNIFID